MNFTNLFQGAFRFTAVAVFALGLYGAIPSDLTNGVDSLWQPLFANAVPYYLDEQECGNYVVSVNTCATYSGNRTPAGTASASTIYSWAGVTGSPYEAFDGNRTTGWAGNGWGDNGNEQNFPAWVKYDFGAGNERIVDEYTLYRCGAQEGGWNHPHYSPSGWSFQCSNDNVNWITLDTQSGEYIRNTDPRTTYTLNNNAAYRYCRIYLTDLYGDTYYYNRYYTNITEMEILGDLPVVDTQPTCDVSVNPSNVDYNGATTLSWSSTLATSMTITGIGSVTPNQSGSQVVSGLTADQTFTCTATDDDGDTDTDSATVTVNNQQTDPTCDVSVNPSSVDYGGSTTLSWSSSNAVSMYITNYGSVSPNQSGSTTIQNLADDTTFTCTATDAQGDTDTDSATVTVGDPQDTQPVCDITVNPSTVDYGESTTVSWTVSDATTLYITDIGYVTVAAGSQTFYGLTSDRTFTCTARDNDGDEDTDSVTVSVNNNQNTDPSCEVWVSDSTLDYGDDVTLYWESDDATSMYVSGVGYVDPNESDSKKFYNLTYDRTFTCTARDADGDEDTDSVTVHVDDEDAEETDPSCEVRVSDRTLDYGDDYTLYWDSDDATSMYITGIGYVDPNESDSKKFYNATYDRTFKCTARDDYGNKDTDTVSIEVDDEDDAYDRPSCSIRANDTSIAYGGNVTLYWNTDDGSYATLTNAGNVALDGSRAFYGLISDKTYTLTVVGDGGTRSCSVNVDVAGHTTYTPPTPTYTPPTYTPPTYTPPTYVPPQVTYTPPTQQVALAHVPYTGAEDYIYPFFLVSIVLTAGYALHNRRRFLNLA